MGRKGWRASRPSLRRGLEWSQKVEDSSEKVEKLSEKVEKKSEKVEMEK